MTTVLYKEINVMKVSVKSACGSYAQSGLIICKPDLNKHIFMTKMLVLMNRIYDSSVKNWLPEMFSKKRKIFYVETNGALIWSLS